MRIDALNCGGAALAEYCRGRHELCAAGVFSSGIYLEDASGGLVMLHDVNCGSLPFGLAGRGIKDRAKELEISAGDTLIIDGGRLLRADGTLLANIGYTPENPVIPMLSANEWTAFIRREGGRLLAESGRSQLAIFASVCSEDIDRASLDDPFAAAGLAGMRRLERGLAAGDGAEISTGLDGLLGLGRGLTPSFDDFIVGAASALNFCAREFSVELSGREELCRVMTEKSDRTNKYSAAYLRAAAAGGRISAIDDMLTLAGSGEWPAAAERLLSVGGSSGADMTSGCIFAARIISGR